MSVMKVLIVIVFFSTVYYLALENLGESVKVPKHQLVGVQLLQEFQFPKSGFGDFHGFQTGHRSLLLRLGRLSNARDNLHFRY